MFVLICFILQLNNMTTTCVSYKIKPGRNLTFLVELPTYLRNMYVYIMYIHTYLHILLELLHVDRVFKYLLFIVFIYYLVAFAPGITLYVAVINYII